MATLTAYRRSQLPSSVFGLPEQRKYPLNSRSHAANAKARATQQFRRGNLSTEQLHAIFGKANKMLGHK
jgi:hypothetical protein